MLRTGIRPQFCCLSLVAFGRAARAANIGGEIRHPEIRWAQVTVTPDGRLARGLGAFVLALPYGWPSLETLRFIALSLFRAAPAAAVGDS
jgi:hypothetical protein